jgi:aminopeptidase N
VDRASVVQRRYVPEAELDATGRSLTASAISALRTVDDQDLRLIWARAATSLAASAEDVELLLDLVDGGWTVQGFEPDQQLRWALVTKAIAFQLDGAEDRLKVEQARDRSDRGQRALIRAEVSQPRHESKMEAWERIHGDGYGSDYLTRSAIMGFQWVHQRDILMPFRDPFYEHIADVYATRDHTYAESYLRWLIPDRWAEASELERIRTFASGLSDEQDLLQRHLVEIADDIERDIRVRAFSAPELIA